MRIVITLFIGLFYSLSAYSQEREFEIYPNGLIYSEQAMSKLGHVVDSLNLKYKTCNSNTAFYSQSQTVGHIVVIEKDRVMEAKADMDKQMSFDDFIKKYPKASIKHNVLFVKSRYKNYSDKDIVEFKEISLTADYGFEISSLDLSLYQKDFSNQWLYTYTGKSSYSDEYLFAFYFPDNFRSAPLPQKYAQMIGYADCLIDTTSTKFKDNLRDDWVDMPDNWAALPLDEKAKLLDSMRSTRVIGYCSMDNRPRQHAANIALLAAETYNWSVFLKSHLDIMNDYFARATDGSYAWGQRETYIKELEELNINVPDLMWGILFRIENPAHNHYFGNSYRIGRALAETKNRKAMKQALASIASDEELDLYNRLQFYFLLKNYEDSLESETEILESILRLDILKQTFPDFISEKL